MDFLDFVSFLRYNGNIKLGEIFAEDKKLAELDPEKRKEERLRLEKSKLEAYFAWLESKRLKIRCMELSSSV